MIMSLRHPKNTSNLSAEEKTMLEEEYYKMQSRASWGYHPGDPRLKSSDKIALDGD